MKRVISLLIIIYMILSFLTYVKADTNGNITLKSTKVSDIKVGDEIIITLTPSTKIKAGDFKIYYDNSKLEFISSSITEDYRVVKDGLIDICIASDSGYSFFTFTFKALKGGNTTISASANAENDGLYIDQNNKLVVSNVEIDNLDIDYVINSKWKVQNQLTSYIITGIKDQTTVENVKNSTNYSTGATAKIYNTKGTELTSGNVTTGSKIKIYDNNMIAKEYNIVIYGDTNQDGNINSVDALAIIKNKLGTEKFANDLTLEAGRVTSDTRSTKGIPTSIDALACIKYKLGTGTIEQ